MAASSPRRKRASTHFATARSIPIASTSSRVFLSPAVSATCTGKPWKSSASSTTSRVVPGTAVTIAASRWAVVWGQCVFAQVRYGGSEGEGGEERAPSQLRSELLPALGGPTMARWIPWRRISPRRPSSRYFRIRSLRSTAFCRAAVRHTCEQMQVDWQEGGEQGGRGERTLLVDAFRDAFVLAKVDQCLDERHSLDRLSAHRVVRSAHLPLRVRAQAACQPFRLK